MKAFRRQQPPHGYICRGLVFCAHFLIKIKYIIKGWNNPYIPSGKLQLFAHFNPDKSQEMKSVNKFPC